MNLDIHDRPGVPADLFDRYWWTGFGDVGHVGTTAQLGLPADDQILAAGNGLVVSTRRTRPPARLLIRDIRTGELVRRIETEIGDPVAVIAGRRLFFSGMLELDYERRRSIDGGVWMIDLDRDDPPSAIVAPGEDLSRLGLVSRIFLRSSPSGRTVVSAVSGDGRLTDVIRVDSTAVTRLRGVAVVSLADDIGIALDEPPTDAPFGWYKAVRLETGETLWRFPSLEERDEHKLWGGGIYAAGSRFIGQFTRQGSEDHAIIATFNPLDGDREALLVQTMGPQGPGPLRLLSDLLGDAHVGLGTEYSLGDQLLENPEIAVMDIDTGEVRHQPFSIDLPWICYPEFCLNR